MLEDFEIVGQASFGPSVYIGHPSAYEEYKSSFRISIPKAKYDILLRGENVTKRQGITGIGIRFGNPPDNIEKLYPILKDTDKMSIMDVDYHTSLDEAKYIDLVKRHLIVLAPNPDFMEFGAYCKKILNFTPKNLDAISELSREDAIKLLDARDTYEETIYCDEDVLNYTTFFNDKAVILASKEERTYQIFISRDDNGLALWVEVIE